jgi:hypothetical protein
MLIGVAATDKTGMPREHGECFQYVANQTRCVISSRAVGIYATGLLRESYATKGFHNKAKSCDWGPMAGFVLTDPSFTKRGTSPDAMKAQAADLVKAQHEGSSEVPIFITDRRRNELVDSLAAMSPVAEGSNINTKVYMAKGKKFILTRALDAPGAEGLQLWMVNYAPGELMYTAPLMKSVAKTIVPVKAVVDPLCPRSVRSTYRAATTGDYDLWAIFPPATGPGGLSKAQDARPVVGSDRYQVPMSAYKAEDKHMGNITNRGRMIKNLLNERIQTATGYRGGDCVHHSDEAGRPCVNSVDYPAIFFVPGKTDPYCIEHDADLLVFFRTVLKFEYYVTFNPGWHKQLGIRISGGGNYETWV